MRCLSVVLSLTKMGLQQLNLGDPPSATCTAPLDAPGATHVSLHQPRSPEPESRLARHWQRPASAAALFAAPHHLAPAPRDPPALWKRQIYFGSLPTPCVQNQRKGGGGVLLDVWNLATQYIKPTGTTTLTPMLFNLSCHASTSGGTVHIRPVHIKTGLPRTLAKRAEQKTKDCEFSTPTGAAASRMFKKEILQFLLKWLAGAAGMLSLKLLHEALHIIGRDGHRPRLI